MKIKLTFIISLITCLGFAQNGINYKAVIKDATGNPISNDQIQVQFDLLQGAAQTNVYSETHTPTTDANGVIILNIGEGTLVSGSSAFNTIDWASDTHFLQVFINTGSGLVDMGTTEFKTVPYAITSGDKTWEKDSNSIYLQTENVGIGTATPTERLEINDIDKAGVKLVVPSLGDFSQIEFRNGSETGAHSFYKIENRSDVLRFKLDTDISAVSGYESRMSLTNDGLALENGTRIDEFSTDVTLAGDSNNAVPTENAVKTYVDNAVSSNNASKTILIPATAFTSNQSSTFANYPNLGAYAQKTSSIGSLLAPLIVPVGATITSMTFYLRDGSSAGNVNLECSVLFGSSSASILSIVFTDSTFGASTSGLTLDYNTPFTTLANNRYIIRVSPTSTWGPADFGICSVKVTYTE